ncbi:hypothetical protein BJY52DRAFT_1301079 [Lactarius psammicola]|nr:hypothetical protein BJY52DRAFT_1301079 [Lactarius psammicola]
MEEEDLRRRHTVTVALLALLARSHSLIFGGPMGQSFLRAKHDSGATTTTVSVIVPAPTTATWTRVRHTRTQSCPAMRARAILSP